MKRRSPALFTVTSAPVCALGAALRGTVFAFAFAAAACSDGPNAPTSPTGTYALSRVDGLAVPMTLYQAFNYQLDVVGGSLEIGADASFVAVVLSHETVDSNLSEYVDSLRGSWDEDLEGNLTFTLTADGTTYLGSWIGNRVNMVLYDGTVMTTLEYSRTR